MASLKFLVVDDSITMRRIVVNTLKNLGYSNIVEAADGEDALAKLQVEGDINFIITDWNMPNMTGLEFVKAVRSNPDTKDLPILMVTTRGMKQDILEAMQAKVNSYVIKPFTPQIIKEKIDKILATL
jgi:two-component system chemotaxis response regulator CheY